jgi:hypothetical protein
VFARFGPFKFRTALANIERWEISGPYRWYTAIGMRGTPGKPETTFGGSAHGGVALVLREPQEWNWFPKLREIYLTLDDLEGFAAELTARGIPGTDIRTGRPVQPV